MTGIPIVTRGSIAIPWTPIWSKNAQASHLPKLSTNKSSTNLPKVGKTTGHPNHPSHPFAKLWQLKTASTSVWLSTLALVTWFCLKGCHLFWQKPWRKLVHLTLHEAYPCSTRERFENTWGSRAAVREGWGHFRPFANPSSINLESRSACSDS